MTAPRVGLIGARRVRQGLGPFVARYLHDAGAEVPCFVATSEESRDAAQAELATRAGIVATGYLDVAAMLAAERLDALAILSPHDTHEAYLDAAAAAGVHVLCEKPLVWGHKELGATAGRIVDAFAERGLVLWEDCQWPYTLRAYAALFPAEAPPERFAMRLSPRATDARMLADCLPHPLSLLQALAPAENASIKDVRVERRSGGKPGVVVRFHYCASDRTVAAEVHLVPQETQPRVMAYAVNGRWARRLIRTADYALFLTDGVRVVTLDDPLQSLVRDFVRAIRVPPNNVGSARTSPIVQRMEMLDSLTAALRETTL